jgi:hypothetical protein
MCKNLVCKGKFCLNHGYCIFQKTSFKTFNFIITFWLYIAKKSKDLGFYDDLVPLNTRYYKLHVQKYIA